MKKIDSNGVLLNPAKLYPLLDAATSSITAAEGPDSLSELYELMSGLRATRTGEVTFLTVPRRPYIYGHNRDELVQPAADRLFTALREDRPVGLRESASPPAAGASAPPTARSSNSPSPKAGSPSFSASGSAYPGTSADRDVCPRAMGVLPRPSAAGAPTGREQGAGGRDRHPS